MEEVAGCAPRAPSLADRADDAPARAWAGAEGQHDVAHADRVRVSDLGDLDTRRVHFEDGDVDRGIPAGDPCGERAAVRARDRDFLVDLHRMVGGDHEALAPVNAGRSEPGAPVHAEDRAAAAVDRRGEIVRETLQPVHSILHR